MTEQQVPTMTLPEFLDWEGRQDERYEYVSGQAYLMAGGTIRHSLIVGEFSARLRDGARARGCRTHSSDMKLRLPDGSIYYPDVFVSCGQPSSQQYEDDAVLVIEVLSSSTRSTDRREKARAYGTLPSIQSYVLVEQDIRSLDLATWSDGEISWSRLSGDSLFSTPYGAWSVDDIYDAGSALAPEN